MRNCIRYGLCEKGKATGFLFGVLHCVYHESLAKETVFEIRSGAVLHI